MEHAQRPSQSERIANLPPAKRALLEQLLQQSQPPPVDDEAKARELPPRREPTDAGPCELSFAQQRLWFLDQFETHPGLYTMARGGQLKGDLSVEALRAALEALVARHEA